MALKRSKISQSADQLTRQGKLKAAIKEYERLLAEKPEDLGSLNKVGDLYRRSGDTHRALACFTRIAKQYQNQGFVQKAIAMYKKVARLDRQSVEVREHLATLHLDLGLVRDAQENLREAARLCAAEDQFQRAMELEYRAVELRPEDWKGLQDLAARLGAAGEVERAVATYLQAAEGFAGAGREESARRCARRALTLAPLDPGSATFLCHHLLAGGEAEKAVAEMRGLLETAPEASHLQALLGQALLQNNQLEAAREVLEAVQDSAYAASDLSCQATYVRLDLRQSHLPAALERLYRLLPVMDEQSEAGPGLDLLSECLQAEPSSRKLLDLLLSRALQADPSDPSTEAALDCLTDRLPLSGRADRLPDVLRRLSLSRPDDADLKEKIAALGGVGLPVADGETEEVSTPVEPQEGVHLSVAEGSSATDEEFISEHLAEADVFIKYRLWEKAVSHLVSITSRCPQTMVAHQRLVDLYREMGERTLAVRQSLALAEACRHRGQQGEAEKAIKDALSHSPEDPALLAARKALGKGQSLAPLLAPAGPAVQPGLEESVRSPGDSSPSSPPPLSRPVSPQVEEEVIEIDFDESAPVLSPAEEAVPRPANVRPGESRVDFGVRPSAGASGAASAGESAADGFFDLAGALEEEMAQEQGTAAGLPVVDDEAAQRGDPVEGIQRALQDQVAAEDHQTHYQLGIAFKEMGLLDSSIGEFQQASRDPENFLACCSMLGLCFREKGMPQIAEKWYQRGLERTTTSAKDQDHRLGLLYDLGELMAEQQDVRQALEMFTEVYATDAGYRQVARRMNDLTAKLSPGPSSVHEGES